MSLKARLRRLAREAEQGSVVILELEDGSVERYTFAEYIEAWRNAGNRVRAGYQGKPLPAPTPFEVAADRARSANVPLRFFPTARFTDAAAASYQSSKSKHQGDEGEPHEH